MKKIFTLICALMGFAGAANAATVDDIALLKHSYVLVMDDVTNNGSAKPGKGNLFGDNHFLDVTGGSVATNKGSVDLSSVDGTLVTEEIAAKYGEWFPPQLFPFEESSGCDCHESDSPVQGNHFLPRQQQG